MTVTSTDGIRYVDLGTQYLEHRDEILSRIDAVLKQGDYILGDEVTMFESAFAFYCGVNDAIAVSNGTESLTLIMKGLNIGPGHEVITVPNSWISSASSIIWAGAKPVFVDVLPNQLMDPSKIEAAITSKTRAIMPVHLTGKVCDMDPIMEIARKHKLHVIEDSAQAVGAKYKGRRAGSIGIAGSFSLHPLKNLNACGDGGVITTNDSILAARLRLLRNHGLVTRDDITRWGYNARLDTVQAAILNVRMKYLKDVHRLRRSNATTYRNKLKKYVQCPDDDSCCFDIYHTFVIQTERRDALQAYLKKHGIGSAIHYAVPIHLHKAAKDLGYKVGDFPVAEAQAKKILSLPIHQNLNSKDIEYVADKIIQFF